MSRVTLGVIRKQNEEYLEEDVLSEVVDEAFRYVVRDIWGGLIGVAFRKTFWIDHIR